MKTTLSIVVALSIVAGSFALAALDWEPTAIIAFVTALIAVVTPMMVNIHKTDKQTETIAQIDDHTNGQLDKRIKAAVAQGIEAHLGRVANALEQRLKDGTND